MGGDPAGALRPKVECCTADELGENSPQSVARSPDLNLSQELRPFLLIGLPELTDGLEVLDGVAGDQSLQLADLDLAITSSVDCDSVFSVRTRSCFTGHQCM